MIWVGGNYNMLSPFALWLLIRRWITMSVHFQSVEEKPRLSANHTRDPTCFRDRHAPALSFDWMSSKSSHRNHQHLGSARGWLLQVRGRKQGAKEGENPFNSALQRHFCTCRRCLLLSKEAVVSWKKETWYHFKTTHAKRKCIHIGVFAWYDPFGTTEQPSPLPLGMHKMGATFVDLMISEVLLVCHRMNYLVIYTCTP
jgi:hypothetical protein